MGRKITRALRRHTGSASQVSQTEADEIGEIGEEIGSKLRTAIDELRGQAREMKDLADAISDAWDKWDTDELERLGALSAADVRRVHSLTDPG